MLKLHLRFKNNNQKWTRTRIDEITSLNKNGKNKNYEEKLKNLCVFLYLELDLCILPSPLPLSIAKKQLLDD